MGLTFVPERDAQISGLLEHVPSAAWQAIRTRKGTWNLGAAAGAWCGLLAFQAIPGNWAAAGMSALYVPAFGTAIGMFVGRSVRNQTNVQEALVKYNTCFVARKNIVSLKKRKRNFNRLRKLADDVCEVSFKNSGKILAAVGIGATLGFTIATTCFGQAVTGQASVGAYLLATLPTAAGLLVTFSKSYAETLNSIFTGEKNPRTSRSLEYIEQQLTDEFRSIRQAL